MHRFQYITRLLLAGLLALTASSAVNANLAPGSSHLAADLHPGETSFNLLLHQGKTDAVTTKTLESLVGPKSGVQANLAQGKAGEAITEGTVIPPKNS